MTPEVFEYMVNQSPEVTARLKQIYETIYEVAPDVTERISYKMPCFYQDHHYYCGFAAYKKHIGFYPGGILGNGFDDAVMIAFGEHLAKALADLGETEPAQLERVKHHPFRAPLLVLALTTIQDHPKVPHFEQILSTGAAVQNFLLSLQAQGFASMWRSGAVVESNWLKQQFGLKEQDLISGIIYIGTAAKTIAPRAEIESQDFLKVWQAT